jgi:hypothetical protein
MSTALETIRYKSVDIYAQGEYVAVRGVAQAMGLDWSAQRRLIESNPWSEGYVVVSTTQLPGDTQARQHFFLHRCCVPMWIANISTGHIADEHTKSVVIRWQKEIAQVLADYYEGKLKVKTPRKPPRYRNGLPSDEYVDRMITRGAVQIPTKYGPLVFDRTDPQYAVSLIKGIIQENFFSATERAEALDDSLTKKIRAQAGQISPVPILSNVPPELENPNSKYWNKPGT